jgi:alkyl sulfatase BDS1-like metallo-beta-lactamase superfamily hydrolase
VTTHTALLGNDKWGIGDTKRVEQVTDGVYAMRGWGIASSFAIEAPDGWIIIDTGDHTPAAIEKRAMLEETLGGKVKVAAILLTHWHYGNGSAAWLDEGAEVWGHEQLDRNLRASTGTSVLSGRMGWFGGDVYDINPLSGNEEAARTVQMMGGIAAVQEAAADAQGGFANWRWTLKFTSLFLEIDPADAVALELRAGPGRRGSSDSARHRPTRAAGT